MVIATICGTLEITPEVVVHPPERQKFLPNMASSAVKGVWLSKLRNPATRSRNSHHQISYNIILNLQGLLLHDQIMLFQDSGAHECDLNWLRAGGKRSTWFPLGRLVEQNGVKKE